MLKLFIDDDVMGKKTQINISQFDMLSDIYSKFIKNETKDSSITLGKFLIYRNIILSGGRMKGKNYGKVIKVYGIKNYSELWWGKIENYIKKDDVIFEMGLGMNGGDCIYLIMKKSDSISKIYSIIKSIIYGNFEIWDMKGNKVVDDENKTITAMNPDSDYYRLIIGDTFERSGKCYEEYLLKYLLGDILRLRYWSQFVEYDLKSKGREWIKRLIKYKLISVNESDSQILADNENTSQRYIDKLDEILINSCKETINKSKQDILSNSKFDYYLPNAFLNSRFLFCVHIIDVFADYFMSITHSLNGFLTATSQFAVIYYVYETRVHPYILDNSMRKILIDILNYSEDLIDRSILDIKYYVKLFLNLFICRSFTDLELDEILYDFYHHCIMDSFPITINQKFHIIYHKHPKTILDLKEVISETTGLPSNQFFFLNYAFNFTPNDEDEFIPSFGYSIEFLASIENIEMMKVVGSGSFGDVHLCKNKLSGQLIALKIIKDKTEDLSREINVLNRFKFSNSLCGYSQLISVNGGIGLAMKFLEEGSLSSYLEKNNIISEIQIAKWCHQILIQINDLHKQRIIHRDIKGDNITLDENLKAHLIDFGVSKYADDKVLVKNYFVGTRNYMAPEYIDKETYSNKIDIWSFGATVIEMVSGEMPFSKMNPVQASFQISKAKKIRYKPRQRISNELKDFIDLCLTPNENERPSAEQLIQSQFILNNWNEINK